MTISQCKSISLWLVRNSIVSRFLARFCFILCSLVTSAHADTDITVFGVMPQNGITRERFVQFSKVVQERYEGVAPGSVKVKLLLDGEAGSEEVMAAALRRGRGQVGTMTIPGASAAVPEMSVLMAPYLFDSFAEEDYVLDHHLAPLMDRLFARYGLTFIGFTDSGWFNLFGRKPLPSPDTIKNRRLRAAGGAASRLFLAAAGADVVEMSFADLLPAVQTGLVDGTITSTVMFEAVGLIRSINHVTMTRHAMNPGVIMANKAWFDKLSPNNQRVIRTAVGPFQDIRDGVRREADEALKKLLQQGLIVHEPTPAELESWRAKGISTHNDLIAQLGGDAQQIYDTIQTGKRAYADVVARRDANASR